MATANIESINRNSAYARHMKVTNRKELENRKKELTERLVRIDKLLELLDKNPEIEEFLDLDK